MKSQAIVSWLEEQVPLLVVLFSLGALVLIPPAILSTGYSPPDDALRHVAKAVSDRSWDEILVLRPEFTIDQHQGWHVLIRSLHQTMGWSTEALLLFSIASLLGLILFSGLPKTRHPEVWLLTLLIVSAFDVQSMRWVFGRPFLISMAFTITLLKSWDRPVTLMNPLRIVLTTIGFAVAGWMHGSWYLFALPIAAFLLSGAPRKAGLLTGCWITGTLLAAALTGHPIAYLTEQLYHMILAMGTPTATRVRVTEFGPADGSPLLFLFVLVLLVNFYKRGDPPAWRQASFVLMMLGWLLGFRVSRFWSDWGLAGLLVWLCSTLDGRWQGIGIRNPWQRVALAAFLSGALFLSYTSDRRERWSRTMRVQRLDAARAEALGDWMPAAGGIVYSDSMRHFYQVFYHHPHGPWRYMVGFEPGLMPPDDLAVYQRVLLNRSDADAFIPWIERMTPADRLFITGPEHTVPPIHQLEWRYGADNLWIGRLPSSP